MPIRDKTALAFYKNYRNNDPNYTKERESYGKAIPSRLFLKKLFKDYPKLEFNEISAIFNLKKVWELEALQNRLNAMIRQGEITLDEKNRVSLFDKKSPIEGMVSGKAEGFGYLDPIEPSQKDHREKRESFYIPPHEMAYLLHKDHVKAIRVGQDSQGRSIVKITERISHGMNEFIGRLYHEGKGASQGIYYLIPDNRNIATEFLIPEGSSLQGAKNLDIVRAKITQYPSPTTIAMATVEEVFGETITAEIEIEQAILEHDLPHTFPEAVRLEMEAIPDKVLPNEIKGRKDYRDLPLVTIDGITARDFDDAVYCAPYQQGNITGYRLYVAIADVTHYARIHTALDEEAHLRGTSVYFPNRVLPMLPPALSNGICSLNPEVDRLIIMAEIIVDEKGEQVACEFYEGVMRSHARLTYDTVHKIISDDTLLRESYASLTPHLDNLYALYKLLAQVRKKRGTIDFDTTETIIRYDDEGNIKEILPDTRNDAHRIIEECMISANIAAARFLQENKINALYRVHMPPKIDKLTHLRAFLKEFSIGLGGGDNPRPLDFAKALNQAKDNEAFEMIQMVLLRSLTQAVYQPENQGHFGLSLTQYTHFTAPIRRYPDLIVHRALKHIIRKRDKATFYSENEMLALGEHSSMTERRAEEAERDVIAALKAKYMANYIGDEFTGRIASVTNFGLFIELDEVYIEGLVHISTLSGDFFIYDEIRQRLIGDHTGFRYRLNDPVTIKVIDANPRTRHIDFELLSPILQGGKSGRYNPGLQPKRARHGKKKLSQKQPRNKRVRKKH